MGGWRCRRYTGGRLGEEFGFKVKGMIGRHLEGAWGPGEVLVGGF